MKRKITFSAIVITIVGLICSCSSTNYLTLWVTEPAPVYVSNKINNIGIINRSVVSGKNEKVDKVDKILSLEGENLDKDGARSTVIGLFDKLVASKKFEGVQIIDNIGMQSPGMGVFPAPLTWEKVDQICQGKEVDAIFELASYDTDAKVDYQVVPITIDGPLGVKIPAVEHHATITTQIKTGWRIYDRINKLILDEFTINETVWKTGVGINPMKAVDAILGRKEQVIQASTQIGQNYALRVLPYDIRVSREYFVRGSDKFKVAKRRARTGDWNGAAELWEKEVKNPKRKIAGRACYNMAIINEINGDLNTAINWASKSYADYNNKYALNYLNILKYRLQQVNELKSQMK